MNLNLVRRLPEIFSLFYEQINSKYFYKDSFQSKPIYTLILLINEDNKKIIPKEFFELKRYNRFS